ncbi:MAG: sn-glycerol-3-phosphate ABC transporter ATP-binding protein UgpC [Rhodobacteraceae bacterium]|nr:sn-glycerol-3-phosphate ABC transporter ATP-binding protein UgpC [Paracoccaceae bacterium]
MAAIVMDNLHKVYAGGVRAVSDIMLDIADGEFVVLVGPSGCGKSTLLRMVAGLETITEGRLTIGDRVVNALEPAERDIAMVFQNYALYPHMSVFNNLAYGLRNRGVLKPEIERRVREAAAMLEIGAFLDRKPRQLSGGQRQRVAMGRALVREPAVFLFDEPLSNLDAKLRVQMRVEIKQLQRRLGTTSLYVTHDQLEAMTMADRLVVLNGGRIEQVGTPMDVYSRPATTFVAGFIGSPAMNMLPASLLRANGNADALSGLPGNADLVGLRPEDIGLDAVAPGGVRLQARLDLLEPAGAETHLHVRLIDGKTRMTVRLSHVPGLTEGADLVLHAPAAALHPFEAESGHRLL